MATVKQAREFDIEAHIKDCDISYRGGNLKVDVSELFGEQAEKNDEQAVMGAYQNYLGGGMAGAVQAGTMFDPDVLGKRDRAAFEVLRERIKKFFYEVNNGGGDEYMQENVTGKDCPMGYLKNQQLAKSGY